MITKIYKDPGYNSATLKETMIGKLATREMFLNVDATYWNEYFSPGDLIELEEGYYFFDKNRCIKPVSELEEHLV